MDKIEFIDEIEELKLKIKEVGSIRQIYNNRYFHGWAVSIILRDSLRYLYIVNTLIIGAFCFSWLLLISHSEYAPTAPGIRGFPSITVLYILILLLFTIPAFNLCILLIFSGFIDQVKFVSVHAISSFGIYVPSLNGNIFSDTKNEMLYSNPLILGIVSFIYIHKNIGQAFNMITMLGGSSALLLFGETNLSVNIYSVISLGIISFSLISFLALFKIYNHSVVWRMIAALSILSSLFLAFTAWAPNSIGPAEDYIIALFSFLLLILAKTVLASYVAAPNNYV